jgi:hypothetical protein
MPFDFRGCRQLGHAKILKWIASQFKEKSHEMSSYPYTVLNSLDEVVSKHSSPCRAIRAMHRLGPGASIDSADERAFQILYASMTGKWPKAEVFTQNRGGQCA